MGAGPAGLFAAFQLGLFDIRCVVVDGKDRVGGQCSAFYADKPIYDAPGFSSILAGELIERLRSQSRLDDGAILLGNRVVSIKGEDEGGLVATLANGRSIAARVVVLATGGGAVDLSPTVDGTEQDATFAVDTSTFMTAVTGLFAIGDTASYPGKLPLILSAFHEAALMTQAARVILADRLASRTKAARSIRRRPRR